MKNQPKPYSIFFMKCPRCLQGKFFASHPFDLRSLNHVKDRCPCCDLNYKIEPSFYFWSMYISYALGIAIAITIYLLTHLLSIEISYKQLFGLITGILVLSMPIIGAWSKTIWANIFMHYDEAIANKLKK